MLEGIIIGILIGTLLGFLMSGLLSINYVRWLEDQILALRIHDVVGRSEQLICPCCGSDKTYKTDAIHCNRCAITTEI